MEYIEQLEKMIKDVTLMIDNAYQIGLSPSDIDDLKDIRDKFNFALNS